MACVAGRTDLSAGQAAGLLELGTSSPASAERPHEGLSEAQLSVVVSMEAAKRLSEPELAEELVSEAAERLSEPEELAAAVQSHCVRAWDVLQSASELRSRLTRSAHWVHSLALPDPSAELWGDGRASATRLPQLRTTVAPRT